MTTAEAAYLATTISGRVVSDTTIRNLCKSGSLECTFSQGRYTVDEDSVRAYFG